MTDVTWTGSGSNSDWSDADNWSSKSVPYSYDNVIFNTGAVVTIDSNISTSNITVSGNVLFKSTGYTLNALNYTLTVNADAVLTLEDVTVESQKPSGTGTIVLDGATLDLDVGQFAGTVYFGTASSSKPNILITRDYDSGPTYSVAKIENLAAGDEIELGSGSNVAEGNSIGFISNGNGSYTLVEYHGTKGADSTWTSTISTDVTFADGASPSEFQLVDDNGTFIIEATSASTTTSATTCYLSGTRIRTPDGDVAVESLRAGDLVTTFVDGREIAAPLVWTGTKRVHAADAGTYPVRIRAGAIGDNVPASDLLVTPEHCMFIDGVFVPARMLVNGRSIICDYSISSFDIWHIETAAHSILLAEGALSESYLDTGNRSSFGRSGSRGRVVDAFSPARSWEKDAAAPLVADRAMAQRIYTDLENRAIQNGLSDTRAALGTTEDPDLHVLTERGEKLSCIRKADGRHLFALPGYARRVRIVSRACAPADAIGPYVDDRRQLGVLVGDAVLWEVGTSHVIDAHLSQQHLQGWHDIETAQCRWTNGDATLDLAGRSGAAQGILGLTILAAGPYLVAEKEQETVRRRA